METNPHNKGFTVMEFLIVVAVIAVLVAIAIPFFSGSLEKSRQAVDAANARSLKALLATMVTDGEIDFTTAKGNTEGNTIGAWVLVTRDANTRPASYNQTNIQGTMYCGANAGVSVNGEQNNWNRENTQLRALVENGIGVLSAKSGGGSTGWDWYLVEYVYDKANDSQQCFVYCGKKNDSSDYSVIKNRLNTNPLAKYMEGRR